MTNDKNTLNGALAELGELMASNLSNKGVEADAEEGLTTLARKMVNITPFLMLSSDRTVIKKAEDPLNPKEDEHATIIALTPHIVTGGVLQGESIDISYDIDDEGWEMTLTPEKEYIIENEKNIINTIILDENNLPVKDVFIRFYIEED